MSRRDYINDPFAPSPNSMVPAVSVALIENQKILLVQRKDNSSWSIPGGKIELGESVADAAKREIWEETGYYITIDKLIGVYSNPHYIIEYDDGEIRQQFALLVKGRIISGVERIDDESINIGFFSQTEILNLNLSPGQVERIKDAFDQKTGGVVK